MVLTETVAAFIKTDLHGISPFISYFCNDSDAFSLSLFYKACKAV
jgi:hypothetical protein